MQLKIGLLGYGVVGVGVYETLEQEAVRIKERTGISLTISRVLVSDLKKHEAAIKKGVPLTDSFDEIVSDDSIQLIVEVMGGMEPAGTYLEKALEAGKKIVTANKELLASKLEDFLALSEANQTELYYEASVGGAVPIIRTLELSQIATPIQSIIGIVNGTTNYMVTQMTKEGVTYQEALQKAQELGFAEANPEADVNGWDAAYKMMILGRIAYGVLLEKDNITVTGITKLVPSDFEVATENGYTLKLIGSMKEQVDQIVAHISPTFVAKQHPLASIENEVNAVTLNGEAFQEMTLVAPGAGRFPTAHSIVTDVLSAAIAIKNGSASTTALSPKTNRNVVSVLDVPADFVCRLSRTSSLTEEPLLQEGEEILSVQTDSLYVKVLNQSPAERWLKHPAFEEWFPLLGGKSI